MGRTQEKNRQAPPSGTRSRPPAQPPAKRTPAESLRRQPNPPRRSVPSGRKGRP